MRRRAERTVHLIRAILRALRAEWVAEFRAAVARPLHSLRFHRHRAAAAVHPRRVLLFARVAAESALAPRPAIGERSILPLGLTHLAAPAIALLRSRGRALLARRIGVRADAVLLPAVGAGLVLSIVAAWRLQFILRQTTVAIAVELAKDFARVRHFLGVDRPVVIRVEQPKERGAGPPEFARGRRALPVPALRRTGRAVL